MRQRWSGSQARMVSSQRVTKMKAWLPANIHTKEGFIRHKEHKQLLVGNQIGNLRHFSIDLNLNRIKPSNHCASLQVLPLQSALLWVGDYINGALNVHSLFLIGPILYRPRWNHSCFAQKQQFFFTLQNRRNISQNSWSI